MRRGATAILLATTFGCSHLEPVPVAPLPKAFVFDQEQGLESSPPALEADVEVASGISDFELALSCSAEGKPCWRAIVVASLVVDRADVPTIKLAWRDHPESPGSDSCTEMAGGDNAARTCALRLSNEWFARPEDARRLGSESRAPIDANGRAHFVVRVDNAGKPLHAQLTARVFQWLE